MLFEFQAACPHNMADTFVAHQAADKRSLDALINADRQNPQLNEKETMKENISKAAQNAKDEQQTTKHLEHWGANSELRDMVSELLGIANARDKTVRTSLVVICQQLTWRSQSL
eukprot:SAG31_NODE_5256_length_2647_cov_1.875981_5_plen_114_part_00